jgi:phosphatidate phosphatase LPIN
MNYDDKVVISDIDGTITKSNIKGMILKNYIHEGVVSLFSLIHKRNYQFIYLTARTISLYAKTYKFIE